MDWTLPPRNPAPPLSQVYTKLKWSQKRRKAYTVEQDDLGDIINVLNEEELHAVGPVRILVQGKRKMKVCAKFTCQNTYFPGFPSKYHIGPK